MTAHQWDIVAVTLRDDQAHSDCDDASADTFLILLDGMEVNRAPTRVLAQQLIDSGDADK